MVKFAALCLVGSLVASFTSASPIEARQVATGRQCQGTTEGEGRAAICGPVVQPLQQVLRYQASNIGQSTGSILSSVNTLVNRVSHQIGLKEVGDIINTATNGLVSGNRKLTNGYYVCLSNLY